MMMSIDARISDPAATISEGGGCRRLVRDYADAMAGRRDWEAAYDVIAAWKGDVAPAWASEDPIDCPDCGFPYYPGRGFTKCPAC